MSRGILISPFSFEMALKRTDIHPTFPISLSFLMTDNARNQMVDISVLALITDFDERHWNISLILYTCFVWASQEPNQTK